MSNKIQENITNRQLFSERFHNLRKQLKLSQRGLSEKLGFSANTQISKIENAKSEPTVEVLRRLAKIEQPNVSIDIHELVTGEPSPGTEKAIRILKPFAHAHLSEINAKIQKLTDEISKLRARGAVDPELITLDLIFKDRNTEQKETTETNLLPLHDSSTVIQKIKDSERLKECQDELEDVQLYYKTVLDVISEFSE